MIFVSDAGGDVTYVSPEWCTYTGQSAGEAAKRGWFACVHPDDHEIARAFLGHAHELHAEFSLRLRLRRADESYAWVMIGAVPSFGPPGRLFLGFLGSLTQISPTGSEPMAAYGTMGHFTPPPMHPATLPGSPLELVADHLLMAHSLIEEDGAKQLLPVLRDALILAGILLARGPGLPDLDHRFH